MKRNLPFLKISLLAALFLMAGCSDDSTENTDASLEVAPASLEFKMSDDEAKTATVTAKNVEWQAVVAEDAKDWLHINVQGDVISVTVDDNETGEERFGDIIVSDKAGRVAEKKVNVKQFESDPSLSATPDHLDFDAVDDNAKVIEVTAIYAEWTAVTEEGLDWLHIVTDMENNTISVTVDNNDAPIARKGNIIISADSELVEDVVVTVTQAGVEFTPNITFTHMLTTYNGQFVDDEVTYDCAQSAMVFGVGDTAADIAYNTAMHTINIQNGRQVQLPLVFTDIWEGDWFEVEIPEGKYVFSFESEKYNVEAGEYDPEYEIVSGASIRKYENWSSVGSETKALYEESVMYVEKADDGEYKIFLDLHFHDGTTAKAYYKGELNVENTTTPPYYSTLTADKSLSIELVSGTMNLLNNYSEVNTWILYMMDANTEMTPYGFVRGSGEYIQLELYSATSVTDAVPVGTYTIGETIAAGAARVGYNEPSNNKKLGCMYFLLQGSTEIGMAPFTSGTVTVSKDGDTYTVTAQGKDDSWKGPFNISVSYTGTFEINDKRQ